jgi:hypothetical protein
VNVTLGDILFGVWALTGLASMIMLTHETDGFCRAVERIREIRKTDGKDDQEEAK